METMEIGENQLDGIVDQSEILYGVHVYIYIYTG